MHTFVIIPTYNEKDNLTSLIEGVFSYLPSANLLVVDDNSPDGTGLLVRNLQMGYGDRLHCLNRPYKAGLGTAYLAGFRYALGQGAQKVVQMDADHSHPVEVLPQILDVSEKFDLVLGSRYVRGGSTPDWPEYRKMISRGANYYARTILGLPFRDITTGYRCFNRQVLESLDLNGVAAEGYGFQVEMLVRAYHAGFSIQEMPIVFKNRKLGKSKMGLSIAWNAAVDVWKLKKIGFGRS